MRKNLLMICTVPCDGGSGLVVSGNFEMILGIGHETTDAVARLGQEVVGDGHPNVGPGHAVFHHKVQDLAAVLVPAVELEHDESRVGHDEILLVRS